MQTVFFAPPMVGSFVKETPAKDEVPLRKCLILAFDDHSEHYLVADWETGEQHWLDTDDVQVDCGKTWAVHGGEDEDEKKNEKKGDPCPVCKQPMPPDEDD